MGYYTIIMKKIPLANTDEYALVDDWNYEIVSNHTWNLMKTSSSLGLVYARAYWPNSGGPLLMHRLIMQPPIGMQVDHINHNGICNLESNMRIVTSSQNHMNQRKSQSLYSDYKGVSWHKLNKKWVAQIVIKKKTIYIGAYDSEKVAAEAYNQVAAVAFGDYAFLNNINS